MGIFAGILLAVMIVFLIFTGKYKKEMFGEKEYCYPAACYLLEKCHFSKLFSAGQKKRIHDIFIGEDFKMAWLKYCCQRISYGIYGILVVLVLMLLFSVSSIMESRKENDGHMIRPEYGAGDREVTEDITLQPEQNSAKSLRGELKFKVKERQYTETDWKEVLQEVTAYIDENVLGKNISLEAVRKPLRLVEKYPGTSVKIKWRTNAEIIKSDGTLKNTWKDDEVPEEGILTEITAEISCGVFKSEYSLFVKVLPEEYTDAENAWHKLEELVLEQEERTRIQEFFDLPEKVGNYSLVFHKEKDGTTAIMGVLGIIFVIIFTMVPVGKIKEEEKKREKQLMMDYPKLINKFVLLIGAGMTIRGVFEKLVQEYGKNRKKGGEKRYVYEEMKAVVRAMENGVSEADSIEAFGKRIHLMPYVRFTSLLIQNRRKGSGDFLFLLEHEAVTAMEQNREVIRVMGEEAGTKLLFPMVIMLCVVFTVMMVPAFLSF